MTGHDIITIGASAGGVEGLLFIARELPPDLPAAVFVVLHIPPSRPSLLPEILARSSRLHVRAAVHGEPIEPGRIYVAPEDRHLLVDDGAVQVCHGPKENGHRPAVDPLFRTAAQVYGGRVVGVILSGTLDCGTNGLLEVKRRGGIAVVQDPNDARFAGMPQSAIDNVPVDHCLPLARIPELLARLAREPAHGPAVEEEPVVEVVEREFTCPECGGDLLRSASGGALSFRCKVGHRYAPQGLARVQDEALEGALWTALRAIEDSAALSRRLAQRAKEQNRWLVAARFEERVRQAEAQATVVRQALHGQPHGEAQK